MSGRLEDGMLALVGQKPATPDAALQLAAIVRNRAIDKADADLLLDALGLLGDSPPAKVNTSAYVHGSQSGVDHHMDLGHHTLCGACQRWVDVRGPGGQGCDGGCATVQGYWRHRSRREATCRVSRDAYNVYQRGQAAAKRQAR